MCLAVTAKVIELEKQHAWVETAGFMHRVNTALIEMPEKGEYVLVHAGFAIEKVEEQAHTEFLESLNARWG